LNFDSKSKRKTGNDITIENQYSNQTEKQGNCKYRLKLIRHVTLDGLHNKAIVDMKAEVSRKILVSIGDDHKLNLYDLEERK
jgi:hypothetical protein